MSASTDAVPPLLREVRKRKAQDPEKEEDEQRKKQQKRDYAIKVYDIETANPVSAKALLDVAKARPPACEESESGYLNLAGILPKVPANEARQLVTEEAIALLDATSDPGKFGQAIRYAADDLDEDQLHAYEPALRTMDGTHLRSIALDYFKARLPVDEKFTLPVLYKFINALASFPSMRKKPSVEMDDDRLEELAELAGYDEEAEE
jgi:hypothetical protein